MARATIHTETRKYIECPNCGDNRSFSIGHLMGGQHSFGTWYCDKCNCGIRGRVDGEEVEVELTERTAESTHVLLELPPQQESVFLITKGYMFDGEMVAQAYFYEEHTCPVNYLRSAEIVIIGKDADPHGLFEYRQTIPKRLNPNLQDVSDAEEILSHFVGAF